MITARLLIGLALLIVGPGCSGTSEPVPEGDITVGDNAFSPSAISVPPGTAITWEWAGNSPHNVTWVGPGAPAASPTQTIGTYERAFPAPGIYDYYCSIHGTSTSGMRGSVAVP
jgi:plastocyanin